ncbi:MAG: 50S ribosomal protein L11 methyltransferase [Sulfuritalea sp.]|jgi:ribosomal protein L11 methyltransferase|nr:50S ribosomal protein L11 methyltransferase [Polynucleobacter sp.]MCF8187448.1 50S ribosomal protein L11 methyltransferase [Sulfuritalea sp.]
MSWTEIVLEVPRQQAEHVSDALIEVGALSVSVEDANEGTEAEQPLFGEPGMEPTEHAWESSRVVALINANDDPAELVHQACAMCDINTLLPFTLRSVADQDWVRLTQSQFEPIRIGKNIWVVPSWHDAPNPDALILELDPGLAFGTGSHPTTKLCMEWLEVNLRSPQSVLDYGCGSGILAMLANKVGAHPVDGVDIDPQAIVSARENAERNQCEVTFFLPEDFAAARQSHRYDVVVANILSGPLKVMAPMLCGRVAKGGWLVLSGVLARQADEVIACYKNYIQLSVSAEFEGWVALAGSLENLAID